MKTFFALLFKDFHWKILTLVLAFILWVIGSNVNNPSQTGRVNVPLQIHNLEILANEGFVLANEYALREEFIQVGIRANRQDLSQLIGATSAVQSSMIVPSIDLRAIDVAQIRNGDGPVTVRLNVGVNLQTGYEHFSINPSFIDVQIDAIVSETFPIMTDVVGEVAPGLELRAISLANNNVTITGSRAHVAQIDRLRVLVNVLGMHADTEITNLPLVALDSNGNDVTSSVQLSVMETTANVPVWTVGNLGIDFYTIGNVAPGFSLSDVRIEPSTIPVVGPASRLLEIDTMLTAIDIENLSQSAIQRIDISSLLPSGIQLLAGTSPVVDVHIEIEPLETRVFEVHRDDVRIFGMAAIYQILDETPLIRIAINGPRSTISSLSAADIGLDLSLRSLQIGVHVVSLNVHVPYGTSLVGAPPALQVQIHEPADPDNEEYYTYYTLPDPPVQYPDNAEDPPEANDNLPPYYSGYEDPYESDPYYDIYYGSLYYGTYDDDGQNQDDEQNETDDLQGEGTGEENTDS